MVLANQVFDDTFDTMIDSLIANVEALACTEKRSMMFINHRKSNINVFHYNENMFPVLGCSQNEKDLLDKLDSEYNTSSSQIEKYIDVVNSYVLDQTNDHYKATYFAIHCMRDTTEDMSEALCLKIIPYIYAKSKSLYATLIVLEFDNHYGVPKLVMHNIDDKSTKIYSWTTKSFIDEERTKLSTIELEILSHSAMGEKEIDIAEQLDMPLSLLKRMKAIIFDKMKVKSISEAIFTAYKQGLIN
ncbi:MAG: helix-turn-helix transcriptional regulator [Tannerellaceae bacterium]